MNESTVTELLWEPLLPEPGLAVAALVAVAALALAWRGSAGVPARRRWTLLALRALGVLGCAVLFLGPTHVETRGRLTREPFVVLVDASRSMRVADADGTRAERVGRWLVERADRFAELATEYEVRFLLFDGAVRGWGSGGASPERGASAGGGPGGGEASPADGGETDLGSALFGVREALDGTRPAGILLVSDGADRGVLRRSFDAGGDEAVERALAELGVPVSTWAVGSLEPAPDLSVHRVHAPPFGFVRRPLTVEVDVRSIALPAGRHALTLRRDGELVASTTVDLPADGEAPARFEVKPDRVGYHTYAVELPIPDGDTLPGNNRYEFTVKVVRDRTRILQVTSRPSWDVKFLRRLLKTDPNVDLVSFFILRERDGEGRLTREGELSLIAFPYEELFTQDLQGFDLVILQNFWFGSFARFPDTPFLQSLADYVNTGGALVMVGGDMSFGAVGYGESPLGPILPTFAPRAEAQEGAFAAVPTAAGLRHPITRLAADPDSNAARWAELPHLGEINPLGAPQPGGVVLLRAGEDGAPVLAARQVGEGRSLAFASSGSWRWALGGDDHAELWRNAVRWLVQDAEQRQVQVITDRENYRLGDPIQVQVRALQEDFGPRAGAPLSLTTDWLDGGAASTVEGATDLDGQFTTAIDATREGTLRISVAVEGIPAPFGEAEGRVSVADREGELEDPRVRPDLLAAIAGATGGLAWTDAPDPSDASARPAEQLRATDRRVEPAWARGPWLALLVLPFGLEWVLRRRVGLR